MTEPTPLNPNETPSKPAQPDASPDPETSTSSAQKVRKRRIDVDTKYILSEGRSKRRRTPTPEPEVVKVEVKHEVVDRRKARDLGRVIYGRIMASKDSEGLSMAEPFIKLPSKRQFAAYYETIKHPMSLEIVNSKLEKESYDSLKDVAADLGQIFTNAKRFNVKESLIFAYAKKLHKLTRDSFAQMTSADQGQSESEHEEEPVRNQPGSTAMAVNTSNEVEGEWEGGEGGPSNASADGESNADGVLKRRRRGAATKEGPTVYRLIKPVLKAIKEARAKDNEQREIAGIFWELPDKKDFADYYQTIAKPISLQEIEQKMLARYYERWEDFFDDIELMCANAMLYNEDESEVYRDAVQIKAMLEYWRTEIRHRLSQAQSLPQSLAQGNISVQKFRIKPTIVTPVRVGSAHRSVEPSLPPQSLPPNLYSAHNPSVPAPLPSPSLQAPLPPLPRGTVSDEIITSLTKYSTQEQQTWAASLPPPAVQLYRQLLAARDAKKRGFVLGDPPSSGRVSNGPIERTIPTIPAIRHFDFAFSARSGLLNSSVKHAIRLYNLKGVITHAVILGSETSEIELTAYLPIPPPTNGENESNGTTTASLEGMPEVSLRVNGNPGSLPRWIYDDEQKEKERGRPCGMKWSVSIPITRIETKLEVVTTRPGAMAETSAIFVNRQ